MGYITRLRRKRTQVINISRNAEDLCERSAIDPSTLKGTGQGGKITVKDVKAALAENMIPVIVSDEEE